MSPNSYVSFNEDGLLCGYQGEHEHEEPVFIWTYSEFEEYIDESITPSMYHFMAGYVRNKISKDELYEIQGGDYCTGDLEAAAIDAYFAIPVYDRIEMHEQELVNMRVQMRRAEARESAAIDAMLEENKPFDSTCPIESDYNDFMRGIIEKSREKIKRLESQIHEEEQWHAY
jgi:hypothetical protein